MHSRADQNDIARCFGYSARSLCRYQKRLRAGGLVDSARSVGQHDELVFSHSPQSLNFPDLVLVNPSAGGGAAKDATPRLEAFAAQNGWRVDLHRTTSAEDLAIKAGAGLARGYRRVFALGGDGTFQQLANAIGVGQEVVLGVLPAGGGNDLAQCLGLPLDPVLAAKILLDGEIRFLDAARVRTSDGKQRLYLGGGGVGLDAQAAQHAGGAYRNMRGRSRYLLAAIRALIGFHPLEIRASIECDENSEFEAQVLVLGVLNTPSYGAGLRLAPEAKTDDGKLNLVLVENLPLFEILRLLPRLMIQGELRTKRVRRQTLRRIRIETQTPAKFHGDGEILGWTPVEIEVVPRAIRMLCPRNGFSQG
jgi:diacylglycerol kinase (ATP)